MLFKYILMMINYIIFTSMVCLRARSLLAFTLYFTPSQPKWPHRVENKSESTSQGLTRALTTLLWWLFPRVQGFWENVRPFIPRLRFSFFFLFF